MFRANPNIPIASMIHENEAFVPGFLQIPRVEDVKTKLSREASCKYLQILRIEDVPTGLKDLVRYVPTGLIS